MTNAFVQAAHKTIWIPVKKLSVLWAQSQRDLDTRRVQRIMDEFDPDYFDELVVTLPDGDGMYHIVDGQHRRWVVHGLYGEDEKVPCRIVDAKDPARAAEIFDKINTSRRAPTALERFKVRVTAGQPDEVAITEVLTLMGYRVHNQGERGCIRAVGALTYVFRTYGLAVLKETLVTIRGTWGDDPGAVEGPFIEGFASLISEYRGQLDWKRLRERTAAAFTPSRLLGHAKSDKEIHGGSVAAGVKRVLVRSYNQGLRKDKLGEER